MESPSSTLCFMGALLFMLGVLTGFGIPSFRSPRIGLSAHLAAIESGLGLIAFGLLMPHLAISAGWAGAVGYTLWIALYILWIGLLFAALYGAGKAMPIAGAGMAAAKAWQESTARILIAIGSLGSAAAILTLLFQWHWAS
jgi:(hydroxyamino)benzene mutase